MDPTETVRAGYDAIAARYTASRLADGDAAQPLLTDLIERLDPDARVLDAGCGGGVVLARLGRRRCVGVDVSMAQLRLARRHAPHARLVCQDMTTLAFPDASFDAIACSYALFHVPRERHASVLANFARMLEPDGLLWLSVGSTDWVGTEGFHGTDMYWSHFGRDRNVELVGEAGFEILDERIAVERPSGRHPFLLAAKR